jgi:hypothetical protein
MIPQNTEDLIVELTTLYPHIAADPILLQHVTFYWIRACDIDLDIAYDIAVILTRISYHEYKIRYIRRNTSPRHINILKDQFDNIQQQLYLTINQLYQNPAAYMASIKTIMNATIDLMQRHQTLTNHIIAAYDVV